MKLKRGIKPLGILLILAGIFIIIAQPFTTTTGAVINLTTAISRIWFFIGLGMILGGVSLIFMSRSLEWKFERDDDTVSGPEFFRRVSKKAPDEKTRALILDNSVISRYSLNRLKEFINQYKEVVIPDTVLDEVGNDEIETYLNDKTVFSEGFEKYRNAAGKVLSRTDKPTLKRELLPYLNGTKNPKDLTRGDLKKIEGLSIRARRRMAEDEGITIKNVDAIPEYSTRKIREYLEKIEVTKGDVDVLASAINEARARQHAVIGERDIDLRQAVEIIKGEQPTLGKYIDFVEPRKKEYVTPNSVIKGHREDYLERKREFRKKKKAS